MVRQKMNNLTNLKPPPDWGEDSLSYFLKGQEQNTISLRLKNEDLFRSFQTLCDTFLDLINSTDKPDNDIQEYLSYFVSMSFNAYLATIRLALGGQRPPTYMVARGCLENALYCFYIFSEPKALDVWKGRNENPGKCRNEFKLGIIKEVLKNQKRDLATKVNELYDLTIDKGAHPNIDALTENLDINSTSGKRKDYFIVPDPRENSSQFWAFLYDVHQIGIASLAIFELVFKDKFLKLGLSDKIKKSNNPFSKMIKEIRKNQSPAD